MTGFEQARRMMVDGQVRTNDVTDTRLLDAFQAVPRERFVPADMAALAYQDRDLPVAGSGAEARYLLKPMVLAKLLHAADLRATDRVLDIACATGYSTAVIAHIASHVVALEQEPTLAREAERNLRELGIDTVAVRTGALADGSPGDGLFDVIVINGAVEFVPEALRAQLTDGGRLVCVLRQGSLGKAMRYVSVAGAVSGRSIFDASAPILPGFVRPREFVF